MPAFSSAMKNRFGFAGRTRLAGTRGPAADGFLVARRLREGHDGHPGLVRGAPRRHAFGRKGEPHPHPKLHRDPIETRSRRSTREEGADLNLFPCFFRGIEHTSFTLALASLLMEAKPDRLVWPRTKGWLLMVFFYFCQSRFRPTSSEM